MNDYGTLGFNANIRYELTSDDKSFVEYAANYIHEALKSNTDYIDSHIILDYENSRYIGVIVWPLEMNNPTPEFMTSNGEWIIFCLQIKIKYEEDKENGK